MNTGRDCLDAETVAAWLDGGLDAAAAAAAEAHASNCERCRALLATVTRTLPAESLVRGTPARSTWGMWRWWLAPLAAGAAAVTLWMVVPGSGDQGSGIGGQAGIREQRANSSEVPAVRDLGRIAETKPESPDRQVPATEPAPAAPVAPSAPAQAALADRARAEPDVAENELRADKREAFAEDATAARAAQAAPAAPAALAELAASEDIIASAQIAPAITWHVGRRGLVLLTTDGATFTRLPFPETVDLVAVTATSATTAEVTAADKRTFHTTDGGRTWRVP